MTTFSLTTDPDAIVGTGGDDTVNGTSATLNASDSLDGGASHDTLALYGAGTFDPNSLAQITRSAILKFESYQAALSSL
jgi:hypothetical protein